MPDDPELEVTPTRLKLHRQGHTAFIEYRRRTGVVEMTHTEVPLDLRGEGIGSELVRSALDWARAENLRVLPSCPFVAAFIERHPEYSELVA
jgi:predicted GNAT family acetyltransferase